MNIELLEKLLKSDSPTGFENTPINSTTKVLIENLKKFESEGLVKMPEKSIGTLIYSIGNGKKKIMLSAHLDEIGLSITGINSNGLIKVSKLGGVDPLTLIAKEVIIHTKSGQVKGILGTRPIHTRRGDSESVELKEILIDVGKSKEAVEKLVRIGDPVTIASDPILEFGDQKIVGKALDDKLGCFIISEVLQKLVNTKNEWFNDYKVYLLFSSQEESGLRGVRSSVLNIQPDYSINVDVTVATDEGREGVSADDLGEIKLGEGVVISRGICISETLVDMLINTAENLTLKYQLHVDQVGGTDTYMIQMYSDNCHTSDVSIGIRNLHSSVEIADKRDILSSIDIIYNLIISRNC